MKVIMFYLFLVISFVIFLPSYGEVKQKRGYEEGYKEAIRMLEGTALSPSYKENFITCVRELYKCQVTK